MKNTLQAATDAPSGVLHRGEIQFDISIRTLSSSFPLEDTHYIARCFFWDGALIFCLTVLKQQI